MPINPKQPKRAKSSSHAEKFLKWDKHHPPPSHPPFRKVFLSKSNLAAKNLDLPWIFGPHSLYSNMLTPKLKVEIVI